MTRPIGAGLLGVLCMSAPAWAGQVTLTMPDAQLRQAIGQVCRWHHLQSCDDVDLRQEAQIVADFLVQLVSANHYASLKAAGASIEVRFEQPQEGSTP